MSKAVRVHLTPRWMRWVATTADDLDSSGGGAHCRWRSALGDTPVQRHPATGCEFRGRDCERPRFHVLRRRAASPATFSEAMSAAECEEVHRRARTGVTRARHDL